MKPHQAKPCEENSIFGWLLGFIGSQQQQDFTYKHYLAGLHNILVIESSTSTFLLLCPSLSWHFKSLVRQNCYLHWARHHCAFKHRDCQWGGLHPNKGGLGIPLTFKNRSKNDRDGTWECLWVMILQPFIFLTNTVLLGHSHSITKQNEIFWVTKAHPTLRHCRSSVVTQASPYKLPFSSKCSWKNLHLFVFCIL